MSDDRSVTEMATVVLMEQAKARAERSGESIEKAMEHVLGTKAGKQLKELRNGPHGEETAEEWRVGMVQKRAENRAEELGEGFEESPEPPQHG